MVDLAEIQAAYYMVAATGVLLAAVFYILNLRISQRNQELMLKAQQQTLETRRLGLIENIASRFTSEESLKRMIELMNYEWTDYADFEKKYGTYGNVEAAAKRNTQWSNINAIGMMLRKGIVEVEDLYVLGLWGIVFFWEKYRPIVEENRRRYGTKEAWRDMEYLAGEMLKYMQSKDPSYRVSEMLDKYDPDK